MKPLIWIVPRALTIDLNAKDINGNEFITVEDTSKLLADNYGYIDGDTHQIVILGRKKNESGK